MTYSREYFKGRYRRRIEADLCVQCGCRMPIEGERMCDPCREAANESNMRRSNKRASMGLCREHGEPTRPGMKGCERCREYWAMRARLRRRNKRGRTTEEDARAT